MATGAVKPHDPPEGPDGKVNATDHHSRIVRTAAQPAKQGYNVRAVLSKPCAETTLIGTQRWLAGHQNVSPHRRRSAGRNSPIMSQPDPARCGLMINCA